MAIYEVRGTDRRKPDSIHLGGHAANVTSFDGEDGIIERIFQLMPPANRFCLEIGAHDGHDGSNSWTLINRHGWASLQIEADPDRFAALSRRYADNPQVQCRQMMAAISGPDSLDSALEQAGAPVDLDFLSLDVDGMDWHLWQGLVRHRPRLLLVEFNHTVPNEVVFIQDPDPSVNQGASLRAFMELGKAKGYELVATTITNAFFVPADEFPRFGIADNSIDAMYWNEAYWTRIFQGYDGSLHLAGFQKLIWKRMLPFTAEDVQPLPRSLRTYG
ncbi:MAG: hypothetical protein FD176_1163 [Rhodospirillaceae bacterium]|nr:MAG: hypothetical protein FD176_1163 [Rhodospirillaceae bacterium]TNC96664.1 MAG: hypothetical protein FD119_1549 [Stygiobacter sp.]